MPHCPTTSRVSPSTLDVLFFPPIPSARPGRQKRANFQLCPCTVCKLLYLPPQVKSTGHRERPGNHKVKLCFTQPLNLPTTGFCTKDTPKRHCKRDMNEENILKTKRCRSHSISPKPWRLLAPARILLRVGIPSLCKAAQAVT